MPDSPHMATRIVRDVLTQRSLGECRKIHSTWQGDLLVTLVEPYSWQGESTLLRRAEVAAGIRGVARAVILHRRLLKIEWA